MSVAWVYQELRAIRERAEARDVEEQIQAVEERLRRVIEARRAVSGAPQPSTVATGADPGSAPVGLNCPDSGAYSGSGPEASVPSKSSREENAYPGSAFLGNLRP